MTLTTHEDALLENTTLLNQASQPGDDYFLLLNTKLKIVTCNQSASKLFGQFNIQAGEQSPKGILELIENSLFTWLKQMFEKAKSGVTSCHEVLLNANSDDSIWVRFTVSPAYNNKNEIVGVACVGCNVHKEKTQEEKLNIQKSVLRQIAQIYSHEIRHPLTNILAIIDLIKCEDYKMTEMYLGFLESASKELDRAIRNVILDSVKAA